MNPEALQERVWRANLELVRQGLVLLTFGNASEIDREQGILAIKPSGVDYEEMTADDMVVLDLDGRPVREGLRPSSDSPSHLEIYRAFPGVGGVVHAHSPEATAFAQAERPIPCLGTTHADFFNGEVPVTRRLTEAEAEGAYERNTGRVIVERFAGLDPQEIPAVLVAGHGPFVWGRTAADAVMNAVALEAAARTARMTLFLRPEGRDFPDYLLRRHFRRKHGPDAYYGQIKKEKPDE